MCNIYIKKNIDQIYWCCRGVTVARAVGRGKCVGTHACGSSDDFLVSYCGVVDETHRGTCPCFLFCNPLLFIWLHLLGVIAV